MKVGKFVMFLSVVLWVLFAGLTIALELLNINSQILTICAIVDSVFIAIFYFWFFRKYIKNHKKVLELQDQYVDTLKPSAPLRFCPSDEELMKYYEQSKQGVEINVSQEKQKNLNEEENKFTKEDSEMELS